MENPSPGPIGATIGFDFKVTSHTQDFSFDLPTATMETQKISLGLPEVTTSTVKWSWSVPEVTMQQSCINGPPETVCTPLVCSAPHCTITWNNQTCSGGGCSGGECSLRAGKQICTDIPQITMRQRDASLDVPSVTMKQTDMSLDLPQFSMQTQHIILTIPDFTLVNVNVATQKMQDDADSLQSDANQATESLTKQMKAEIKSTATKDVSETFSCYEARIANQRDVQLAQIDGQIAAAQSDANAARASSNASVGSQIDQVVNQLVTQRASIVTAYNQAIATLHDSRDKAIAQAVSN